MTSSRFYHCAAVVDSTLYVLAGSVADTDTALSSVESYNTKTNKWSSAGHLIHAVWGAACATYSNCIYVFGGTNIQSVDVDHVQVYNPAQETCTVLGTPLPHAYNAMRVVLWETFAILLGRHNCFIYNFDTQTWQERNKFKTGVDWLECVQVEDQNFTAARNVEVATVVVRVDIINSTRTHSLGSVDDFVRLGDGSRLAKTAGNQHPDSSHQQDAREMIWVLHSK